MKVDVSRRHPGPELMDGNDIPREDLFQNYRELHKVNNLLGGYRITLKGLSQFISSTGSLSVLDVGCGGGDTLKTIAAWGRKKQLSLQLTGVDLSEAAIRYSKENNKSFPEIEFIQEDVFQHLKSEKKYDVILNSLFMHHFTDEQIISLLSLMKKSAQSGFIINDLQRHPLAYRSIKLLTTLFSKSYLVKNDAPLSVLRGFREEDWWHLLSKAYIANAKITREWAFRYLIVYSKPLNDGPGVV